MTKLIDAVSLNLLTVTDLDRLSALCYADCYPLDCDCPNALPR